MQNQLYAAISAAFATEGTKTNHTKTNHIKTNSIEDELSAIAVTGTGTLPSWFAVTELAVASIGAAGLMLSRLAASAGGDSAGGDSAVGYLPPCTVDQRLASMWFKSTLRPIGWSLPPIWNAVAGNYRTKDGWIRLHTNVPAHRAAALSVLQTAEDRDAVAETVADWEGVALMNAIVDAGGCAATMNSMAEWRSHPQGQAVAQEPLIHWDEHGSGTASVSATAATTMIDPKRPLAGIRILDLTRILAGPISTRFLAAYGADVLRIDPPVWDEPANIPEVVLGKRCAGLDLRQPGDQAIFAKLLQEADVLVHGYRPGALEGLGFGPEALRSLNPRLIDVSLNAYGWSGPWATRRGFDSLVQMSCGIADFGMSQERSDVPFPLPAQALDHATGYLMAAAVLHALRQRHVDGTVISARLSLARTAELLMPTHSTQKSRGFAEETAADLSPTIEKTAWGDGRRIQFPLEIEGIASRWPYPASRLRSVEPIWP